ncbi:Globin [Popillia japonica]|uniref:Globin n=1 Tax=Popillia japonica TaxID=7064 RepID=A0AAW1MCW9_POPJA
MEINSSNEADPVTGFTQREKYLVTSSFELVKKDMVGAGTRLFMNLFEQKPEYQEYFSFKDIPRKDLPNSPKFKAHAVTVMYALSSFIANLDETDIFMHLLKKNANSHIQKHIPAEAFDFVPKILVNIIKEIFGSKIDEEGVNAWNKVLTVAFKVITDTIKNANE